MNHIRCIVGLMLLSIFLLPANAVRAERVPSVKVVAPRLPGVRGDITVPYLTNGFSNLGVYQGVAPFIDPRPNVSDRANPQVRATFNLPFYGGTRSFGDANDGAVSKPKERVPH